MMTQPNPQTPRPPCHTLDLTGRDLAGAAPPPDLLETEWLLTNGLGGFAMGTVCGCNTRRYHGCLIAALRPPVQRFNLLASIVETIGLHGRAFELSCHEFTTPDGPTVFHPDGWRHLRTFQKQPDVCRWVYHVGPVRIVKELRLIRRRHAAVLRYRIEPAPTPAPGTSGTSGGGGGTGILPGDQPLHLPVTLTLRPLLALRDFHHHRRATGTEQFRVACDARPHITVRAAGAPDLNLMADAGRFERRLDWWYGFRHRAETERGQDDTEDLLCPGLFEHTFGADAAGAAHELTLLVGTEPLDAAMARRDDPPEANPARPSIKTFGSRLQRAVRHVADRLPADGDLAARRSAAALVCAADDFIVERRIGERAMASILAGYPWFADWGRDTMIALPGLMLCTGRFDDARCTLLTYARHIHRGLIPNRFDDYGGPPHYNTADASLWFIHAALEYLRLSGDRRTWDEALAEACKQIIDAYRSGTDGPIRMDETDALIVAGDEHTQLTWMDAKRDGIVFTPRHGKAVEINALWHRAVAGLADATADRAEAEACRRLTQRVRASFNRVFWDDRLGYLIDHVSERGPDRSLRPNQALAVSLPAGLLDRDRARRVMRAVRERLLTPRGLRTLPPDDPYYHGRYAGSMFERDRAYHQGTVWAWLIGPYIEGWLRAHDFSDSARDHAREAIRPLIEELSRHSLGQLHEVFDGDPPHRPGGCIAQAWSIAEVLRALILIECDRRG